MEELHSYTCIYTHVTKIVKYGFPRMHAEQKGLDTRRPKTEVERICALYERATMSAKQRSKKVGSKLDLYHKKFDDPVVTKTTEHNLTSYKMF